MRADSAFDAAVDRGGCIETSRPTTCSETTYAEERAVRYCGATIPGAVARTSTLALTSATLPYLPKIIGEGDQGRRPAKRPGMLRGELVSEPGAEAHVPLHEDHRKILG